MNRRAEHGAAPLALSSAEKSVTVQTNTQTVTDISTLCLSAYVDNNTLLILLQTYIPITTTWVYCVECLQYSTRLEALGYLCDCLSGRPKITGGKSNWTNSNSDVIFSLLSIGMYG